MTQTMLGVIGGSGLYDLPELQEIRTLDPPTPFGPTSDPIRMGRLGETEVAFLARHGRGHRHTPTELPFRANIYALKQVGVTHLLSISAVGSLAEELPPRSVVIPDQIIDRTTSRPRTFFGDGIVAHVGLADPFCSSMRDALTTAAQAVDGNVRSGGTYLCIEGPQFSTRAESNLYRSWGAGVIGMTAMPEARLAREAELCYATLAMVTDYDVWHETEDDVTVEMVMQVLRANVEIGRQIIRRIAASGLPERTCGCQDALGTAIATAPEHVSPATRRHLGVIVERYLPLESA